jgi:hypothetical protein
VLDEQTPAAATAVRLVVQDGALDKTALTDVAVVCAARSYSPVTRVHSHLPVTSSSSLNSLFQIKAMFKATNCDN